MLSLWLEKCMLWLSEQRLVDQENTVRRNSWMTELEIEELERKVTGSNSVIVEEKEMLRFFLVISRRRQEQCFAGNRGRRPVEKEQMKKMLPLSWKLQK